jgi:hypothetical protein
VPPPPSTVAAQTSSTSLKQLKGGLTLVFDPASEGPEEISMEEMRAQQPRYQKMLIRAAVATKAAAAAAATPN